MESATLAPGLYVVATPIGNLGDISVRALDVLRRVDRVAAEDTRVSGQLLSMLGISKPMLSVRAHNEPQGADKVIELIRAGESIAFVTDAGTPAISDPGCRLVEVVRAAGFSVVPLPGPCAAVAALSVSGLSCGSWLFAGFLPPRAKARQDTLASLKAQSCALVFYEAPHRLRETLADMAQVLGGERRIFIARELTKRFEELAAMRLAETASWLDASDYHETGEFVLVVEGVEDNRPILAEAGRIARVLAEELPASQAAKLAAKITGYKKSELYAVLMREHE